MPEEPQQQPERAVEPAKKKRGDYELFPGVEPDHMDEVYPLSDLTVWKRRKLVLQLLVRGMSRRDVAKRVGLRKYRVDQIVASEIERAKKSAHRTADGVREIESQRFDEYTLRLMPMITGRHDDGRRYNYRNEGGSVIRAVEAAIKVAERRAKMLGLDAPVAATNLNINAELASLTGPELEAEAARLGLILPAAKDLPRLLPGDHSTAPLEPLLPAPPQGPLE